MKSDDAQRSQMLDRWLHIHLCVHLIVHSYSAAISCSFFFFVLAQAAFIELNRPLRWVQFNYLCMPLFKRCNWFCVLHYKLRISLLITETPKAGDIDSVASALECKVSTNSFLCWKLNKSSQMTKCAQINCLRSHFLSFVYQKNERPLAFSFVMFFFGLLSMC